jgi:hypothetical protein
LVSVDNNEYRLAQNHHNSDSNPPWRDRDGLTPRFVKGMDQSEGDCDNVIVDRTTGEVVLRYDAADPANTNPYYGATTDGECMRKKGLEINEMVSHNLIITTPQSLAKIFLPNDSFDYFD